MEIDTLLEALKDFEKKAKKEPTPVLEQFLCHVSKTGETLVPWSQFKSYFIFKLEKVMDDFKATAPEQRGPSNPNVECIPFEEMKARILKIVNGYTGIPFTIQRLCELLTEPKRNYTGTEKFLRGVEKNVMVVSCVHPTSEKNGCSGVSRMNGVMLPGNTSAFAERKVNGPGTPRPLNRQKVSLASSLATNGLPDSTENKDPNTGSGHSKTHSEASPSGPSRVLTRSKHSVKDEEEEESLEEEQPEVKRLKFLKDGEEGGAEEEEEDDEEEEDEEEEAEVDPAPPAEAETHRPAALAPESSTDAKQALAQSSGSPSDKRDEELEEEEEDSGPASSTAACQDQEPSSTQSEASSEESKAGEKKEKKKGAAAKREADSEERELPSGSNDSPNSEPTDMDQSEQSAPSGTAASPESREAGEESNEHVSSSSSSSSSSSCSEESEESSAAPAATPSDSTTEPPTEGTPESASSAAQDSATAEEPMEVD